MKILFNVFYYRKSILLLFKDIICYMLIIIYNLLFFFIIFSNFVKYLNDIRIKEVYQKKYLITALVNLIFSIEY